MGRLSLSAAIEKVRLAKPFRISGYVFEDSDLLVVTLREGGHEGRGEASGVYYLGDDAPHMLAEVERVRASIEAGVSREELRALLPPGGARNAIDCALWELEAKRSGSPVWKLAGLPSTKSLVTTFTLSADDPDVMAQGARDYVQARSLKLKLTGEAELDSARVRAVRQARPDAWMGVDANQGYTIDELDRLVAALVDCDVKLLEQPLARGREADLQGYRSPIPIAADESALSLVDIPGLVGRFDVVNIKLDKCGGLTEGLMMAAEARRLGLDVMVGNMIATSLAMAPAFVLGQHCDIVDLDGPIFLAADRVPGVVYNDGLVWCGDEVWGSADAIAA
ncbi:MAG: dipeptide epimerase [Luteimonas sp.]|nr:dipeptide epimerase [Luteimonas sp.]